MMLFLLDLPIASCKPKRACTQHDIAQYCACNHLRQTFSAFFSTLSVVYVLKPVENALSHSGWKASMDNEIVALIDRQTWDLVDHPFDCSTVGCICIFIVKYHPDGAVERLKARLIAKVYTLSYAI